MSPCFVITGTDTDVGKTVFAAALVRALDGCYWKPVQCGLEPETDAQTVGRLSGLPADRIVPEAYRFQLPASPHLAAEREGIEIDPGLLQLPNVGRPLVVEGAGGLMVPLTRGSLVIDLFARWQAPVILCARTRLGTINHSLLSIEALRRRNIPLHGIVFIGEQETGPEDTIVAMGTVRRLGRLPNLASLTPQALQQAFEHHFHRQDFAL
jgi:dethiobiotin synthetase